MNKRKERWGPFSLNKLNAQINLNLRSWIMSIIEKMPNEIQVDELVLFSAASDVDVVGNMCEEWLVITASAIMLFEKDGTKLRDIKFDNVKDARLNHVIGGGYLVVDTYGGSIVLNRFTGIKVKVFSVACKVIKSLATGEDLPPLSKRDLPHYCSKCKRPIQDELTQCPRCIDKKKVAFRILAYAKPYKGKMVLASIMVMITTLMTLVPPYITKIIVDDVLTVKTPGVLLLLLVLTLGMTQLMQAGLDVGTGYLGVWIGSRIMRDFRKRTYDALMDLSLSFFDRNQISQFIGRVNSDVESIRQFLTDGVLFITSQMIMLISIIIVMFSMNWKLTLLATLPTPFVIFFTRVIWPLIRNRRYGQWRSINQLNMIVGDSLQGIRVVKAFGQEQQEKTRYYLGSEEVMKENIRTDGLWSGIFPIVTYVIGTGTLLIWYFGGQLVVNDQMTLGVLMAFISYLGMFFGPLRWISQAINWMSRAFSAADRVFEIIDAKSDVPQADQPIKIEEMTGRVEFKNVTFGYESHFPVLKEVNLVVEPGEMIGLVGHSGAGKSTLINLLSRFYDPDHGDILIDGYNLRDLDQEDLHKYVGVVLQETFLFDGTVAENIAYSKPDASPEAIIEAAKVANAHDFIVDLAEGYDTPVGERGQLLSGGQKQRIAIARAVLHNPKILILDEATASVDTETEKKIQTALARLVKGRTTFAIAHRLSTLRYADRLVVIDKGRVAEVGSHDELLDQKGIYYRLVEAQREMSQIKGVVR